MLKKSLLVIAAVALIASVAQAGAIKVHEWPSTTVTTYDKIEICTIDVIMDVGYWIHIKNQNWKLEVIQVTPLQYEGCLDLQVECNFDIKLYCSIVGIIPGTWSCWFDNNGEVDAPCGTIALCAKVTNVNLGAYSPADNVPAATITVKAKPQA